jgi:hypothetical protein
MLHIITFIDSSKIDLITLEYVFLNKSLIRLFKIHI